MSETNDGLYVVMNFQNGSRLTVGSNAVTGLAGHLNDLTEVDETDPEGLSPIDGILDNIQTIVAAANVKLGMMNGTSPGASSQVVNSGSVPSEGRSCAHGPMKYKEGVSKAGKPYKGYFCNAPYGQEQCKAQFLN